MSLSLNILTFLSLLVLAFPLAATAKSSSYNPLVRWKYLGCYNETLFHEDGMGLRALYEGISESLPTMTMRMCITFCDSNDYPFAGTEYGQECYCSYILSDLSKKLNASYCDTPCAGNETETCGGHFKLNIFERHKLNGAAGLKPPSLVDGKKGAMGSMLALGVTVVALLYFTW